MRRALSCLLATAACSGQSLPPVAAPADPSAHEIHLVAFASTERAYLVLERVVGPQAILELVVVRPESRQRTRFGAIDARLDPWPGAAALVTTLRASATGTAIEKLGFTWPRPAGANDTLETELGSLEISRDSIHLSDGDYRTRVAELADVEPEERTWVLSSDGRWAAAALTYAGEPSTRDLRVIALEPAAAELFALRAFEHHQRREFETALSLWQEAVRLDPTSPRSLYNLACAHARVGNAEPALSHLRAAIELGGDRFRKLALRDHDLDSLRGNAELDALLRWPADRKCPWQVPVITCN